jgi:hypothetical protein
MKAMAKAYKSLLYTILQPVTSQQSTRRATVGRGAERQWDRDGRLASWKKGQEPGSCRKGVKPACLTKEEPGRTETSTEGV